MCVLYEYTHIPPIYNAVYYSTVQYSTHHATNEENCAGTRVHREFLPDQTKCHHFSINKQSKIYSTIKKLLISIKSAYLGTFYEYLVF